MHRSEPEFVGRPENAELRLGGDRSTTINVCRHISGVRAENTYIVSGVMAGRWEDGKTNGKCPQVHAHLAEGGKLVPAGARPLGLPHRFNLAYNPRTLFSSKSTTCVLVCTLPSKSKHGKLQQDDSTPTGSQLLSVTALPSSIMPAPVSGAPASQRDRCATPADANTIHQDFCLPAIAAHGRLTIHVRPGLALLQIPLRDDNVWVPRTWQNGNSSSGEGARPHSNSFDTYSNILLGIYGIQDIRSVIFG